MDGIRQYLLSVMTAALISAVAVKLMGTKGIYSATVKLLAGLFLSITIISPLVKMQSLNLNNYFGQLESDASNAVTGGEFLASEAMASIIKDRVSAYILDKASDFDLQLDVEVTLTNSDPPAIDTIMLQGTVSPYARGQIERIIAEDIGVPKERQLWK